MARPSAILGRQTKGVSGEGATEATVRAETRNDLLCCQIRRLLIGRARSERLPAVGLDREAERANPQDRVLVVDEHVYASAIDDSDQPGRVVVPDTGEVVPLLADRQHLA